MIGIHLGHCDSNIRRYVNFEENVTWLMGMLSKHFSDTRRYGKAHVRLDEVPIQSSVAGKAALSIPCRRALYLC